MSKTIQSEGEEEILKEICACHGLSLGQLPEQGPLCTRLEMFFSGMPKILGLSKFQNLQELCIMGQAISKIENLSCCTKLKELWLCEMQIKKIEGLENLKSLKRLFLYDNKISKIENLGHCSQLQTLWLNINNIQEIEGLAALKHLTDLNLAQNQITKIGNTLNSQLQLEKLELSGNKLYSFKDITYLQKLPFLVELGLKSPGYPPNPVGLLCNYSTHVLYHLPSLQRLDQLTFSDSSVKDISEATVEKKKMYYNMRCKTVWRQFAEVEGKMCDLKNYILKAPNNCIRTLAYIIKGLERELREMETPRIIITGSGTESDKDARDDQAAEIHQKMGQIKTKIAALKERIQRWQKKTDEVEAHYNDGVDLVHQSSELQVHRLVVELEMGGNVRFEDGTIDDIWFTACHDLILSRFCIADYRDCGVSGIKIHRITRVHNRLLRLKFEEALATELEDSDTYYPPNKSINYKKLLEYLFWVYDPELPGGATEMERVLEEGFMDPDMLKQLGKEAAVPLTNSISLADRLRIKHLVKQSRGKQFRDNCPFRHGKIIITKVYIGKSAQVSESKGIEKRSYSKFDTVFRPRNEEDETMYKIEGSPMMMSLGGDMSMSRTQCECSNRQSEWFVFNNALAIPEYIVDFEYITRLAPKSPFLSVEESTKASKNHSSVAESKLDSDDDVIGLPPELDSRARLSQLSRESLLLLTGCPSLDAITVLDLYGNGLAKLKGINTLVNLQRLYVSFNELSRLDDVTQMSIEHLDASFNKIATLEGFKGMQKLKYLDLTWNTLQNTREDVSILRKHCPVLATLDVRHNNWQKKEGLRLRAIGRIKTLTMLNGLPVLEQESAAALRMAAGSRISQVSLLSHSRTDPERPRSLSLASSAQILSMYSRNRPDRTNDHDNIWLYKITTLNLDSQHISKISNLDRLENLKFASFNDNDITKIEGLELCVNLVELSLEHNCVSRIEGISKLVNLQYLMLGHNYIQSLDNCGLDRLLNLRYLSIESNRLKSLVGLQRCRSMVELYVGNNRIVNLREIFVLKNLLLLGILDLFGNPVVSTAENYRLFVIYHLKALKALDGTAIEPSEGAMAKDAFGGRLTQDFVAERLNNSNFNEIRELDFPQCSIRSVDLTSGDVFLNLRSVNLEHNSLTSFSGLIYLVNLRVLCLNHNHVECVVPRGKNQPSATKAAAPRSVYSTNSAVSYPAASESHAPVLESLEVLHLAYNGIKDMSALQLGRVPSIKALFLQGNEISVVSGLEMLQDLRELVLDRNKIKALGDGALANQWNLQELHLEENRLKELSNLGCLENLQRLFLGMNRLQDMGELEKLEPLRSLVELSLVSNAVARRMLHRPLLVFRMPGLHIIDGIPVSEEERAKADLYYVEQQDDKNSLDAKWLAYCFPGVYIDKPEAPAMPIATEAGLPGLGNYKSQVPVKVTNMNMQLMGPYINMTSTVVPPPGQNWPGALHTNEDMLQGRRVLNPNDKRIEGQPPTNSTSNKQIPGNLSFQHGSQDRRSSNQTTQYRNTQFGSITSNKGMKR